MQLDSFLKLDEQPGTSTDETHTQEFEILTFHHRIHRAADLTGDEDARRPAAATHGEITVCMALDTKTPLLLKAICTAIQYTKATIVCRGGVLDGQEVKQKALYSLVAEKVILTRVHYVTNPLLHGFGRNSMPLATSRATRWGPLVEVEMLYYGRITWKYDTVTKFVTPDA